MAKVTSEKKYVTFVKGLITEANPLTFPENASLDEDNFDLKRDGSRERRLGIDYEDGYTLVNTGITSGIMAGTKTSFHRWDFPGGSADVVIGVIRAYNKLWFVNLLSPSPSSNLLNGGNPITISGLANAEIDTATITNYFVIASSDLTWPVLLSYDKTTDTVSQEDFPIQVRDIWGVDDELEINNRPANLLAKHEYNLRNQGWSSQIEVPTVIYASWQLNHAYVIGDIITYGGKYYTCVIAHTSTSDSHNFNGDIGNWLEVTNIDTSTITPTRVFKYSSNSWDYIDQQVYSPILALTSTKNILNVYPSNADIWTLGKIGASTSTNFEKYDANSLKRNSIDNTEAPKGSFIIDLKARGSSRGILTGFTTLPLDREEGNVTTIAAYAGRLCYSGIASSIVDKDSRSQNLSGSVLFSQIIENKNSFGKCYQEADPTSSAISDLVDTDGGIIQIPEASKIVKLVSVKDSLIVFAENGIWEIFGDAGGFKATNFQISKISSTGVSSPHSIVAAGASVVYWAKAGIFALTSNPTTGRYESQSLSLTTIQTYYEELSDLTKKYARGFFDERENHIRWIYNDTADYAEDVNVNSYNRILNLDMTLQAFYKYSISSLGTSSPIISSFVDIPQNVSGTAVADVYVDNDPVLSVTDQVQINVSSTTARTSRYNFLTFVGSSFTLSKFKEPSFMDWKSVDGVGVDYSSYLITGHEVFADTMRTKQIPYIWFYFTRTESGFELDDLGNIVAKTQSSCQVQARWNWANSDVQGKWGTQFQAYRYLRPYIPSGLADTYDTGDSVIVTKNKFRGSGKSISIKFQSEQGKDIKLLGWALIVTGDGTP
jgi:hypothetical protein